MKTNYHKNPIAAKLTALRALINRHRVVTLIIVGAVGIMAIGGIAYSFWNAPVSKPAPYTIPQRPKPKPKYYSPLTGLEVPSQVDTTKPVTAIMIENSPDARPQSGLKDGEVVYEAIAEGGITRFLVLYQQNKPDLIGPVRSVRPYYLDWARPYDASIAHVGGSSLALQQVRDGSWRDIDQFFNGSYYWRASDRYAPHNVYTSFAKLDALNQAKGYTSSHPAEMKRTDGKAVSQPDATSISVHISGPLYDSSYTYDKTSNAYTRSEGGEVHNDREKGAITPAVVVVMEVPTTQVFEDTFRESMQTTGSGKVTIFQNGTVIQGNWHKNTAADQLSFTDADGKDISLVRGQTWITAIPSDTGSVSWQK